MAILQAPFEGQKGAETRLKSLFYVTRWIFSLICFYNVLHLIHSNPVSAHMIDPRLPLTDIHRHLDGNIRAQTILDLG
ncbi:TPA: hypothetical protein ACYSPP_004063, partial [Yersinia enterocolitica]